MYKSSILPDGNAIVLKKKQWDVRYYPPRRAGSGCKTKCRWNRQKGNEESTGRQN